MAKDTAYYRALVDFALNKLHYLGYEGRYRRDVLQAADDPDAFPDGVDGDLFHERPELAKNAGWPADYVPAPPISDDEVVDARRRAKSPTIAAYLLKWMAKPSDADVRALAARFLNFADPRARWAMAKRLAFWSGAPEPERPVERRADDGVLHVASSPGLDAAVAAWKARLGV